MRRFVGLAHCRQLFVVIGMVLIGMLLAGTAGLPRRSIPIVRGCEGGFTATVPLSGSSFHGFTLPPIEGGHHLVTLVAFDIDGDGDLDVVGSDESLDLFVWENDGRGHLSRKYPRRSNGWRAESPEPTFHDRLVRSHAVAQNHGPTVRMNQRALPDEPAASRLCLSGSGATPRRVAASTSPRAPPTSCLRT